MTPRDPYRPASRSGGPCPECGRPVALMTQAKLRPPKVGKPESWETFVTVHTWVCPNGHVHPSNAP